MGNTVQSLDRGLRILEILARERSPMSVTEIASFLGIDKSTAYRLLATMQQRNYVYQVIETRKYALGAKLVELGNLVLENMDLRGMAQPFLHELVEQIDETAYLGVMVGDYPVYADRVDSVHPIAVTSRVGEPADGHCSGIGKGLCAYLSPSELTRVLGKDPLPSFTPRTITTLAGLETHFKKVRECGYAIDDEESHEGVRCLAAPVWNHEACVVASIGVSAPALRLTPDKLDETARIIVDVAQRLSQRLGYNGVENQLPVASSKG